MCVCVCVCAWMEWCVCVCVCAWVGVGAGEARWLWGRACMPTCEMVARPFCAEMNSGVAPLLVLCGGGWVSGLVGEWVSE